MLRKRARSNVSVVQKGREDQKSSFGRFGDDLTELIVSYLSLEDKLRFECLSKRWQTLVFAKQNRLIVDHRFAYKSSARVVVNRLESVLKKCPNISSIDISIAVNNSDKVLELIVK